MFKIKAPDGTNNICGRNLKRIRQSRRPIISQRKLAALCQLSGYEVDHHFIRRVETGERFVTDIEIRMLCEALAVKYEDLMGPNP